jgi:type I restriction enzyme, R subunit
MRPSNFTFLHPEWAELHEPATRAEGLVLVDARGACFYARRTLELAVRWLYKHDAELRMPYDDRLSTLLHEPSFRARVDAAVFPKARVIKDLGNRAVHGSRRVQQYDALVAVRELFHVLFWLARTYGRASKPTDGLAFDQSLLSTTPPASTKSAEELRRLEEELQAHDERLTEVLSERASLDNELDRLRAEVAAARAANEVVRDQHDYSEELTREYFIDLLLKEAGWTLEDGRDREFEVQGMPNAKGVGFVDYVLWGDDGKPLGVVEAKKSRRDPRAGRQQAKLYADCLEKQFGQRPVILYSNGYDHWIWDDLQYPPRPVQGFYKKPELELIVQRRESRKRLADAPINGAIAGRYYQTRAIRRVGETFERDNLRKTLVVMATGAGKTRTVIALCDQLMRVGWAKRILFLADRVALVRQAVNAFKTHLPEASPVNLVTERDIEGRVYVSTYPTMMGLIDETKGSERRFGVGHFDLVVIDEAHRSVYQKYGAIFEYFDALLVGLTATPKEEIDRNTYKLFELESGVPTDAYTLDDAVRDGYLVPPRAVSVPLKYQREGIRYEDLTEEEKEEWDTKEWFEGERPEHVDAAAINKWLFNTDTVDKVLGHLMTRGIKVAGGDRIGKTIVFAKNHDHAEFIAERFDLNYPRYRGAFARVIDFKVEYAQSLIEDFEQVDLAPHIAISVDMLDTGIDVPEVVNLVFFKIVRSKTKFWQMVGRGTRLREGLFGPGQNKEFFYIFDYCGNLEFFSQDLPTTDGAVTDSLSKRLFVRRLELIGALDDRKEGDRSTTMSLSWSKAEYELRCALATRLHAEVEAMNDGNFVVRPKRELVDRYKVAEAWETLSEQEIGELARHVAGLPSELDPEDEEAKRFDLLLLNLQLGRLETTRLFSKQRDQLEAIAALLEEKGAIPTVRDQMELILAVQTDEWWQDVTVGMLEDVRKRLRGLVRLIDRRKRTPIYTDFQDERGDEKEIELPGVVSATDFERFRAKARDFLRRHENHITVHKLRTNQPLTDSDLHELERMIAESGIGTSEDIERAKKESEGLGLFVRALVGLDREAAVKAFERFMQGRTLTGQQIEFIDMMIGHLTEHGVMDPGLLYSSPFTDFSPHGADGLFGASRAVELIAVLEEIRKRAAA